MMQMGCHLRTIKTHRCACRFSKAMGIGQSIYVLVDVIVADVYHDSAILTEKLTILYLMISLALVASPSVGSFCGIAFGWQSVTWNGKLRVSPEENWLNTTKYYAYTIIIMCLCTDL